MKKLDEDFEVLNEGRGGSYFALTKDGYIEFGGGGQYEGWYDQLSREQVKELYEMLKKLYT